LADFQAFIQASSMDDAAKHLLPASHGEANLLALFYRNHLIERRLTPGDSQPAAGGAPFQLGIFRPGTLRQGLVLRSVGCSHLVLRRRQILRRR
jgi:hypothetical protein